MDDCSFGTLLFSSLLPKYTYIEIYGPDRELPLPACPFTKSIPALKKHYMIFIVKTRDPVKLILQK